VEAAMTAEVLRESLPAELTADELETLHLIADGLTDDQIAATLYRSLAAIKNRGERIRAKLGATTRAHAVALGYQRGYLVVDPDAHIADVHELAAALQRAGYRLTRTGVPS
jgi:DNA-binding CsgD family transcriptional regulator